MEWEHLEVGTKDLIIPRYGHSCTAFKHKIYIFGGIVEKRYKYEKENFSIFDTEKNTYTQDRTVKIDFITWRAFHIAISVGNTMFIHGGLDNFNKPIEDIWLFSYVTHSWRRPVMYFHPKCSRPLFRHSACLVADPKQQSSERFGIYNFVLLKEKRPSSIVHQGIYVFGGKLESGEVTNRLQVLKIGASPLKWVIPDTVGQSPEARMDCSMNFLPEKNFLVIHGGRNDQLYDYQFGDIFILDCEYLMWVRVPVKGEAPQIRAEHNSAVIDNKLLIFGGKTKNMICDNDVYALKGEIGTSKNIGIEKRAVKINRHGTIDFSKDKINKFKAIKLKKHLNRKGTMILGSAPMEIKTKREELQEESSRKKTMRSIFNNLSKNKII